MSPGESDRVGQSSCSKTDCKRDEEERGSVDGIPLRTLPGSTTRGLTVDATRGKVPKSNLWKVVRNAVGKDLTRLTLPVFLNEPLSFLQRVMEDIEYSELLDEAASASLQKSARRPALIGAFVASHYAATLGRTLKPFNPLLGETYELIRHGETGSVAAIAEQVSHHPPITAVHARGEGWTYYTAYEVRSKFHGNTLEAWPEGVVHVEFDDGGHFVYEQVHTMVHNLVMGGSMSIDNVGVVEIKDVGTGLFETCLRFRKGGRKHGGGVVGEVRQGGEVVVEICGNWWEEMRVDDQVVWKACEKTEKSQTGGHGLTGYAWSLNCGDEGGGMMKTDSRRRPDQRALEEGRFEEATRQKDKLERGQRQRRKEGVVHSARWFERREGQWRYAGGYFRAKMMRREGTEDEKDLVDIDIFGELEE